MKSHFLSGWLLKLSALFYFSFLLNGVVHGQCLSNTYLEPFYTVVPTYFDGVTPNEISSCNFEAEYAIVQVNANQYHVFYSSNPNTFITISANNGASAVAYGTGEVAYTPTTSGTVRVYFNANANCGTNNSCIETKVLIGPIPGCIKPLGITFSNLTSTTVDLAWSATNPPPSGGYEYYYGNPANPPTTTTLPSGTTITPSASLSSLTPNTDYGFWVRSSCGSNGKSAWSTVKTFKTQHVVSRPWTEGFALSGVIPAGFNANSNEWFVTNTPGGTEGNPGNFINVNQYSSMYQFETVNISGVLATDYLKFDYRYYDVWNAPAAPPANDGYFKIYISSNFGQTYTQIDSVTNNTNPVWTTKAYPLSAYSGQTIRIKIESYRISAGFGYFKAGFDNFFVGNVPCIQPVVYLGPDTTICQGTSLTLNPGNNPGATYAWSNGSSAQTLAVNSAGTYHVTVTNGTCSASDTVIVNTVLHPAVDLGNDTTICNTGSHQLDAGAGTGYTYLWSNNATSQTINVNTAGTYSVTVTNPNGCIGRDTVDLAFNTAPTVNSIIATGNPSPTFNFEANGANNVTNYLWNFGHNGATATGATATYTYPSLSTPATYTVTLTVSNECGHIDATKEVSVIPVSINELDLDNSKLKLFPNPGKYSVKLINESNFKMKQITISDILGKTVANIPVKNSAQQVIDVNNLPAGLYNVRIEFEEGTVIRKLEVIK